MYIKIKTKFDKEVSYAQCNSNQSYMIYSILKVKKKNIGKTNLKVLQILLNKLQLYHCASGLGYISQNQLITAI